MTVPPERGSLLPEMSEWPVRDLTPRRIGTTLAVIGCAYASTAMVLFLPGVPAFQRIPAFNGHDTAAWSYVSYATLVGLCLSLFPRVSALRGLVLAYGSMGVAGAAALAYMNLVIFPDGYVKSGDRLWGSFGSLAVANLVTGTVALRIGLRCSLLEAVLGAITALLSLPFAVPIVFVVMLGLALVQGLARALVGG
jgi:hypothetical protein